MTDAKGFVINAIKFPRCAVPRGAARFATALAGAGDAPSAWLSGYTRGRKAGKKTRDSPQAREVNSHASGPVGADDIFPARTLTPCTP
jgi:hypothetical protein